MCAQLVGENRRVRNSLGSLGSAQHAPGRMLSNYTENKYLAFLLEETARKILPEAVLTCCVSGNIHMGCGYYKWGSCNIIRYSDIDAASVCVGSHSTS